MNDIFINKVQSIQRCVQRAREEYNADRDGFTSNYTRQDAAILNVLRACEAAIDLANHAIREYKLGIPVSSADSFALLGNGGVIDSVMAGRLTKMVAFRNIVVHQYTRIDIAIAQTVIASGLDELIAFGDAIQKYINGAK